MQLISNGSQGPAVIPAKQVPSGTPGFANSGPAGVVAPTRWDPDIANTIIAEISNVILAAGIVLNASDNSQLLEAIRALGLAFTPVQQGGGIGQLPNKVYFGWDGSAPRVTIDTTDIGKVVMLPSFTRNTGTPGTGYQFDQLPNGTIFQAFEGVNVSGADFITFPIAFPNTCTECIACEAAPVGWAGVSPTIFGTQQLSSTSFALYVSKWNGTSWALTGGISYRYLARGY